MEDLPLRPCPKCESKETVKKNVYVEDGLDSEYELHCAKCDTYLGLYSYGSWQY